MTLLIITMLILLISGMPVAFSILISTALFMIIASMGQSGPDLVVLAHRVVSGSNSYILLAVPFFTLAGELMNSGGVTRRLVGFFETLLGSVRGGLAYVVVMVNMVMAGVSGAAIADAAAVGSVLIPAMTRNRYNRGFAAAVNAAAATVGPVIPPSVGFIIYASLSGVSVGKLFLAGAIPGLIMGLYMMAVCYIVARRKNLPASKKTDRREILRASKDAFWALIMPAVILGCIIFGIVTPTEAGVLAVLYGLFVGLFVYKQISIKDVPYLLVKSAKQSAVIMLIIAVAQAFGWVLVREGAPELILSGFSRLSDQAWVFLAVINIIFLFLGCFMEGGSLMIVLTPLLLPVLARYNIDPIHFGVVFQLNIMLGLLTPPVGMLLYVIVGVSDVPMHEILVNLWPFFLVLVLALILITYIPEITLWLPSLAMVKY